MRGQLWHGQIQDGGIPGVARSSKLITTHRAAWIVTHGPIPDGLQVLHRCDNPPCCNPAHLFLGTQLDNVSDMNAKRRHGGGKPATMVDFTCEGCHRTMTVPLAWTHNVEGGHRRFCSKSCANRRKRKQ